LGSVSKKAEKNPRGAILSRAIIRGPNAGPDQK
jgi:hypothetical protein